MSEPKSNNAAVSHGQRTSIFVVDDEPMLLELAMVILEPLGYQVTTFRDPQQALRAYGKSPPDLLITDYAMHEMNGLALLEGCRKIRPTQKVLLISGTVDESVYSGTKGKPDAFLAKPYTTKQLVEAVKNVLKDSPQPKSAR
jgi:DNA-binding NtrC family response regulator